MYVDDFPMFSLLELADKYVKKFEYFRKYEPLRTPLRTMLTNYCLVLIGLALEAVLANFCRRTQIRITQIVL